MRCGGNKFGGLQKIRCMNPILLWMEFEEQGDKTLVWYRVGALCRNKEIREKLKIYKTWKAF